MIIPAILHCLLLISGAGAGPDLSVSAQSLGPPVRAVRVEELRLEPEPNEEAFLARPVFLAAEAGRVYVADGLDCAIKVFSEDGRFEASLGRKGQAPGEFSFPSGVSAHGGRLYVADKFNRRIQILNAAGHPLGGFPVPFFPDRVFALAPDRILVTRNPSAGPGPQKRLLLYDQGGTLVWEGLEAFASGDTVYDTFRNMILVNPGPDGGFLVVFRSHERSILRFGPDGSLVGRVPVDERLPFQPMSLPVSGPEKTLLGFCWASALDSGLLYLLPPESVDGRDLGPGRRVVAVDAAGRLRETIDLPRPVSAIAVAGRRLFVVDAEGRLGIFRILR